MSSGRVRIAVYPPNFVKDPATGALRGWTIDVAGEIGRRLGIAADPVECDTPPDAIAALAADRADFAILGIEAARARHVDYSPALVELDYTVLVRAGSPISTIDDVDRPGARIAAVRNHASTLALERRLSHAKLVYADMLEPAFALFLEGQADVFASVREIVLRCATKVPGSRVLDGRYGSNRLALAVLKGRTERLAWASALADDLKASGFLQKALDRTDWRGARVAGDDAVS